MTEILVLELTYRDWRNMDDSALQPQLTTTNLKTMHRFMDGTYVEAIADMNADVWKKYNTTPQFDLALDADDETADAFIRANAFGGTFRFLSSLCN